MVQRIELAVSVMIENDGELLLVKEGKPQSYGKWNQPAGHIEADESPFECAIRETKEVCGYDIELTSLQGVYSRIDPKDEYYINFCFTAKPKNLIQSPLVANDILETRWFSREELKTLAPEALRHELARKRIEDWLSRKKFPLEAIYHFIGTKYQ